MLTVETSKPSEESEMRRVKNNVQIQNPAVMFARGVESLISDPLYSPSRHDNEEFAELRHVARKQDSRGNLFNVLMRQFSNL